MGLYLIVVLASCQLCHVAVLVPLCAHLRLTGRRRFLRDPLHSKWLGNKWLDDMNDGLFFFNHTARRRKSGEKKS
jgi:hypothetical protein